MLLTKGQITAAIISSADIIQKSSISDRSGIWLRLETQAALFDRSLSLLSHSREICNMHKALIYFLHSHKWLENNYIEKSHQKKKKKKKIFGPFGCFGYTQFVIPTKDICFPCSLFLPSSAIYHFYAPKGHSVMQYEAMKGIKLHILHWFSIVSVIFNVRTWVGVRAGSLRASVLHENHPLGADKISCELQRGDRQPPEEEEEGGRR